MDYLNIILKAIDSPIECVLLSDDKSTIILANSAIQNLLGYTPEELYGKKLSFILSNFSKNILTDTNFLSNSNSSKKKTEVTGIHLKGQKIPLELSISRFKHNNILYAKSLLTFIKNRKINEKKIHQQKLELKEKVKTKKIELEKANHQLNLTNQHLEIEIKKNKAAQIKIRKALEAERELNQLKTKFISMASHEFRTPLSGIHTSAALLEKYNANKDVRISKHIHIIKKLVLQLNNVLDEFLSLEKIEKGDNKQHPSYFELNELIEKIISEAKSFVKKGQEITFNYNKNESSLIYHDKKIIYVILTNLLYNAIKYSGEHTKIAIQIEFKDEVEISIKDQGMGIPAKDQAYIFRRFFRASNTLHIQGTGIGLNIAKAHIKKMDGTITFTSEENIGTEFIIKIPSNVLDQSKY